MTSDADQKPALTSETSAHWTAKGFSNPYLLLSLTCLFWSGNHIVGRAMGGHVPPMAISTLRWMIPAIVLFVIGHRQIRKDWPVIRKHWKIVLWLSMTGGTIFTALQYVGLEYTSALNVSVMNSLVPVLIVATSALIFQDHISPRQMLGIVTSSIGVLVIIAKGQIGTLLALDFNAGDLITIVSMIDFAIYSAFLRLRPPIHWTTFIFMLAVISSLGTSPLFIAESMSGYTLQPTWLTVGGILYVGIFPSLLAFAGWNRGIELIGANRAGPFIHLIPVYTAILSGVLLGEHLALFHIAGFALILSGVWLAAKRATA